MSTQDICLTHTLGVRAIYFRFGASSQSSSSSSSSLALTFLFLWLNATANASARPPPPLPPLVPAPAPPPAPGPVEFAVTPGTAAALRSLFSALLTRFSRPPPTPPLPRIEARRSSLAPDCCGRAGAAVESRPDGRGGGGGPPAASRGGGNGGGGGGPLIDAAGGGGGGLDDDGRGGGGGAPLDGNGGGGGGPAEGAGTRGTARCWGWGAATGGGGGGVDTVGDLRWLGRGGGGGGPADGGGAFGVLGGSGGGATPLGGTACPSAGSLEPRGEEGRGARLGGGGGAEDWCLSPWNGGGTLNLGLISSSSSIGVFGGRGGGGGPGFVRFELARCLPGSGGAAVCAYLPASARGGGALNFGRGGDGALSGAAGGES